MNNDPTCFVIFGVTGDLARTKLIPALFDLYIRDCIPSKFCLIGFSRRQWSNEQFKDFVREVLKESGKSDLSMIDSFLDGARFIEGVFEDRDPYTALAEGIADIEENEFSQCGNKLFYLSVPPENYMTILDHIAHTGLSVPCSDSEGWSRILIEKPFGRDSDTAEELDRKLGEMFEEKQIFRIDHYLAKEAVQNILTFRFSNPIFRSIWEGRHIDRVEVTMYEDDDLSGRGEFYDGVGALRDVGQNHVLQMAALAVMREPEDLSAERIREARAEALRALHAPTAETGVLRGQYKGYRSEEKVDPESRTETYFKIRTSIEHKEWEGTELVLESGKALNRTEVAIRVFFDEKGSDRASEVRGKTNQLTFRIQPNEGINIHFWFKVPGFDLGLEERTLSFLYSDTDSLIPDAYERVLFDCIHGDQTLFASTEEVMAQWKFIQSVSQSWENSPLVEYEKGIDPKEIGKDKRL